MVSIRMYVLDNSHLSSPVSAMWIQLAPSSGLKAGTASKLNPLPGRVMARACFFASKRAPGRWGARGVVDERDCLLGSAWTLQVNPPLVVELDDFVDVPEFGAKHRRAGEAALQPGSLGDASLHDQGSEAVVHLLSALAYRLVQPDVVVEFLEALLQVHFVAPFGLDVLSNECRNSEWCLKCPRRSWVSGRTEAPAPTRCR